MCRINWPGRSGLREWEPRSPRTRAFERRCCLNLSCSEFEKPWVEGMLIEDGATEKRKREKGFQCQYVKQTS